jgi:diaminopimelate epimerase
LNFNLKSSSAGDNNQSLKTPFMKKRLFITMLLVVLFVSLAKAQQDSIALNVAPDSVALTQDSVVTTSSKRIRVNGFRIQVYYGGNNKKSKQEAYNMAGRVKIWFENLRVYTSFSSPHWICRAGDFQTREEAMEVLQAMRESGRFPRAIIVKSKVFIREDELRRKEPTDSCATGNSASCNTNIGTVGRGPAEGGLAKDSTACCKSND